MVLLHEQHGPPLGCLTWDPSFAQSIEDKADSVCVL